jgi:hypothetical protein
MDIYKKRSGFKPVIREPPGTRVLFQAVCKYTFLTLTK